MMSTMPVETTLYSDFGADLLQSYEAMSRCAQAVTQAIADEANDYQMVVPTFGESLEDAQSQKARREAIRAITQLHFPLESAPPLVPSGILCASQSTIDLIGQFNDAKQAFREVVLSIRWAENGEVATEVGKGRRTPLLRHLLRNAKINTLDLSRCYTQIRVLPTGVESLRWTWATNHSRMRKVSVKEAYTLLDALPADRQVGIELARDLLSRCQSGEILVHKRSQLHQLRANYTIRDENGRQNRSCSISGIIVQPGTQLPKYKWRDDPGETGNARPKRGAPIEDHPYIQILDLYRYVTG